MIQPGFRFLWDPAVRHSNLILAGPDEPNPTSFTSLPLLSDPPMLCGTGELSMDWWCCQKVTWKPQCKLVLWKSKVAFSQGHGFGVTAHCKRGRMQQNNNYLHFLKPEFCKTEVMRL